MPLRTTQRAAIGIGSARHVMLFPENLIRALLIFSELRSHHCQRALLEYHYPPHRGRSGVNGARSASWETVPSCAAVVRVGPRVVATAGGGRVTGTGRRGAAAARAPALRATGLSAVRRRPDRR